MRGVATMCYKVFAYNSPREMTKPTRSAIVGATGCQCQIVLTSGAKIDGQPHASKKGGADQRGGSPGLKACPAVQHELADALRLTVSGGDLARGLDSHDSSACRTPPRGLAYGDDR